MTQTERITKESTQAEVDARFFAIATDLVGAPTGLLDESGGIAWRTRSTLWGTTTWNAGATAYTPLRFPGQYADPETGLHYNFHRHYDSTTARYLSQDPLGLDPSPNPVTHVHNPHTWADPLGLKACEPGGFKVGVTPDEIARMNRDFGGEVELSGSPSNTMTNASRYDSFWEKSAVMIRDIAGGHMFNNGNKRTAQAVVEELMRRNSVTSGPTSADLRSVIDRVGKGQLHEVGDISKALRGY